MGRFSDSAFRQRWAEELAATPNWGPATGTGRYGYKVDCSVSRDGEIAITTSSVLDGAVTQLQRDVLKTKEAVIREALIKLGWTPPSDAS